MGKELLLGKNDIFEVISKLLIKQIACINRTTFTILIYDLRSS